MVAKNCFVTEGMVAIRPRIALRLKVWSESVVSRETALPNQCIVTRMDRSASSGHSGEMERQRWTSASTGQHCAAINCQNNRKNRAK